MVQLSSLSLSPLAFDLDEREEEEEERARENILWTCFYLQLITG